MNRIDALAKASRRGEGILSVTLCPNGAREYGNMLERVDFLVNCGLNQLMLIYLDPDAGKIAGIAPTEMRLVKQETAEGVYREMFLDNVREIRRRYSQLPIIGTVQVGEAICYGAGRLFQHFHEVGVDGIDTPCYVASEDPIGFRKQAEEAGIHFLGGVFTDNLDMKDPDQLKKLDNVVKVCKGELLFVPTVQGSTKSLSGEKFRPIVQHIREVQAKNDIHAKIISISGINTPEETTTLTTCLPSTAPSTSAPLRRPRAWSPARP